jgi:diadenosine tetraphosphatase ApaH/serine/threonine PP2A family protein phosphatase
MLEDCRRRGGFDEVWCLGDVVGYGAEPEACIDLLYQHAVTAVVGNHDRGVLGQVDLRHFNEEAAIAGLWTARRLSPAHKERLSRLPETALKEPFTLVHGSLRAPVWEYLLSTKAAQATFSLLTTPYCLVGHSHVPFVCRETKHGCAFERWPEGGPLSLGTERLIINPGSVGQPRDGDPRTSYALYDNEANTIAHHRVEYDIAATQEKIRRAGLPEWLAERLSLGR